MDTYAKRLEAAMRGKGLSAPSLAAKIGTTRQAIGQVLNEKSKTLGVVYHLAASRALGIAPDWLATGEGEADEPARYAVAVKHTPDSLQSALELVDQAIADLSPMLQSAGVDQLRAWVEKKQNPKQSAEIIAALKQAGKSLPSLDVSKIPVESKRHYPEKSMPNDLAKQHITH
jgi:transcriptional regulator with XRE-family HTH domain